MTLSKAEDCAERDLDGGGIKSVHRVTLCSCVTLSGDFMDRFQCQTSQQFLSGVGEATGDGGEATTSFVSGTLNFRSSEIINRGRPRI